MNYYVAIAHRWNNLNDHFYVVGISKDLVALRAAAEDEVESRGGKYGVGIYRHDNALVDYIPTRITGDAPTGPFDNPLTEAARTIGLEVIQTVKHGPGELPDWLRAVAVQAMEEAAEEVEPLHVQHEQEGILRTSRDVAIAVNGGLGAFWKTVRYTLEDLPELDDIRLKIILPLQEAATDIISAVRSPKNFLLTEGDAMRQAAQSELDGMEARPHMYAGSYLDFESAYRINLRFAYWEDEVPSEEHHQVPKLSSTYHQVCESLGYRTKTPISTQVGSWEQMLAAMKMWRSLMSAS